MNRSAKMLTNFLLKRQTWREIEVICQILMLSHLRKDPGKHRRRSVGGAMGAPRDSPGEASQPLLSRQLGRTATPTKFRVFDELAIHLPTH